MATITSEGSFGDRIRDARNAAGLTQVGLGELVGVRYQTVQHWEANRTLPTAKLWTDIEDVLGLDRGIVYRWTEYFPKAYDHPSVTSGKRCFPTVAAALRDYVCVIPEQVNHAPA